MPTMIVFSFVLFCVFLYFRNQNNNYRDETQQQKQIVNKSSTSVALGDELVFSYRRPDAFKSVCVCVCV